MVAGPEARRSTTNIWLLLSTIEGQVYLKSRLKILCCTKTSTHLDFQIWLSVEVRGLLLSEHSRSRTPTRTPQRVLLRFVKHPRATCLIGALVKFARVKRDVHFARIWWVAGTWHSILSQRLGCTHTNRRAAKLESVGPT
jgi:hypothetical protein